MSSKDAFFKKVQDNNAAQLSNAERVQTDIKNFRARVFELSKDVEQWLQGSGVKVTRSEVSLDDESVIYALGNNASGRYSITQTRLTNGEKTALLDPEALYYVGSAGCVSLTISNPYRAPAHVKFTLFMHVEGQQEEGWTITRNGQKDTKDTLLTEEVFFAAIEALA